MRIIQTVNVRWFNATAWYGLFLSRLLKEAGHEVLVLGLKGTDSFAKAQEWGLNPRHLDMNTRNPLRWKSLARETANIIREFQPDLVNCHRGEAFILWALLKSYAKGYALVRTRGDQRLPRNSWINRLLHNKVADAVIATNSAMSRHFVETINVDKDKVFTIIGGVDKKNFQPQPELRDKIRAKLGYTPDDFVCGLLGRLDEVKGQKELIQAVAELRRQGHEHLRLLLLGFSSGLPEETVRGWIKDANLESVVSITGKRPDIAECIQALDLGVVPSLWSEAIARAALELMACGIPIIGNRVGVMPDILPDVALIEPGNVAELEKLLLHCILHPDFRAKIKEHESEIMTGLGAEQFLESTLNVYAQALKRRFGERHETHRQTN